MTISTAVDVSAVARVLGIKVEFQDLRAGNILYLPQRIAVVGQGATASVYSTTKQQFSSAVDVATTYGFGSPLHLAAQQLFPANGDGVGSIPVTFYPLVDDGAGVAAVGDITVAGAQTEQASYVVRVNGISSLPFIISVGDSTTDIATAIAAAINGQLDLPITASSALAVVTLTAKWKGTSGNDLFVEVIGSTTAGSTFAITQPVGGLVNPDVDDALNQVGDVWETLVLNCLEVSDTTSLDKYQTFGNGRWGALTNKPLIVFSGTTEADVNTAIAIPDARKLDRINCQLPAPGSVNLPFVVAARALVRIAVVANNNPPQDYGSQVVTGIIPGLDSEQWTYPERDQAVKAGSSTIEVRDGVVFLSDVVTFYHPSGELLPPYRYVVDIIRLQNAIFNVRRRLATPEWDGAPLLPDGDSTNNPTAKKPKMAKAEIAALVDNLGLDAILSDPEFTKANIQANISATNPKRLDLSVPVKLSGNNNITSIDLNFGFLFGGS